MCSHVGHDLSVDLFDVLLCGRKFLLQSYFFLLQGILSPFGELVDQSVNFGLHLALVHRVDNVLTVSVKLGWKYLRHGLGRVGLIYACGLLDELLK